MKIQKGEFLNSIRSLVAGVLSFEDKRVDGKNAILFKVMIGFEKGNKKWFIEKRFSEFDKLHQKIKDQYPNIPSIPAKTMFKVTDEKIIDSRRKSLD